jgi:hypothetical protein
MLTFPSFFNAQAGAYEIEQSLRFDGSGPSRLTYDNTSGTNNSSSAWTLSFWMKRGSDITSSPYGNDLHLMMWTPSGSCTNTEYFLVADPNHGNTTIQNCMSFNGGGYYGNAINKLRDPSAWYHFVWRGNTGSSANIIYINGVPVTAYNQGPTSITAALVNGATRWSIGDSYTGCSSSPWDGYLAEVHFVDGQTLDHEDFGEFDDNGVWRPIRYTGTYGTNGYYLKFDPSATNGVGHDHSGNGHHWTASGFDTTNSTAATYDVMSDTPTTNWCTLNPLEKPGGTAPVYENGNLTLRNSTNYFFSHGVGTFALNSGKWYFETSGDTSAYVQIGFVDSSQIASMTGGGGINGANRSWNYQSVGIIRGLSSTYQDTGLTAATTAGDIMGLAIDFDAGSASWYVNGTQVGSTVDFSSYLASGRTWYPVVAVTNEGTDITNVNFGQRAFAYTPPTGYKALNTANLPAPTVKDGSDYFNTVTYTGDGTSSNAITGVGFQPDWLWIKKRNDTENHNLFDVLRGVDISLQSNNTNAEFDAGVTMLSSFDTDGFTLGSNGGVNANTHTFVAWNWKAGGSGSSNTDGSITSTVSANPTAGFSIVSWTGTGNSETVGHGLGVAPSFYILKSRDNVEDWAAYFTVVDGSLDYIALNTGNTKSDSGLTAPTSTVIYRGTADANNEKMIAYCFAEVEGYSKFGSYTGNGNADGPFIHLGFKPAWLVIKNITTAQGWYLNDSARNPYNLNYLALFPANSGAESASTGGAAYDFLSNGFKPRTGNNDSNGLNDTYVFMAFAEHPFGGSGVSPATAR